MSDVFGISVSALQAFQQALDVTSNNIANASTPGYARETINLSAAAPDTNGPSIGNGVVVDGVSRSFNQATANQLNTSQSTLGQLNALQTYSTQIDNIVGTTAGGLSTAVQGYYSAWADVANSPASSATRQALLGKAQSVAASFQSTSAQLNAMDTSVNSSITADVQQINTLGASISTLNKQIAISTADGGGQPPNDLIDQRDQLVSNLSKLTGITTTTDTNGAVNVFVGNGQPLVLQGSLTPLTTVGNKFDASQLEISSAGSNGNVISASITSGDLGGLLAARTQVIDPAKNQLGQIATAFSATVNAQQGVGLDLNGKLGANLFSIGAPLATASSKNTGTAAAAVTVTGVGALTTNDYLLTYQGGAYSLTNAATGAPVASTGAGTTLSPLVADGLTIVMSGTPVAGDQFLVQPTVGGAGSLSVATTDPSKIAAAAALNPVAATTNTGSGAISSGTVTDPTNPALLTAATIAFTTPTTYTINGGAAQTYTAGGNIAANGWQVQISGAPAAGDSFTVQSNAGATGDNRNALIAAKQQSTPVLSNGTVSISDAVNGLITGVGSQAQQINTAQAAQTAVNTQAVNNQQSVSGVNLDEEAASLLQWQQAYGAAAKALQIGSSLFTSLLTALQSVA